MVMYSCLPKAELQKPVTGQILKITDAGGLPIDTLQFDTLFGGIKSISKRILIYNTADYAVNIESIRLKNNNSGYQLVVNGETNNNATTVFLRANDSIIIFVNSYFENKNQSSKYSLVDELIFEYQSISQSVIIKTFGKDATKINETTLAQNTVWDNSSVKYLKGNIIEYRASCQKYVLPCAELLILNSAKRL